MNNQDAYQIVLRLKGLFEIVRFVDVSRSTQYTIDDEGKLQEGPYQCYAVWKKTERCENCISEKAFANRCRTMKFEFVDNDIYLVLAKYIVVDGKEYVLEAVAHVDEDTMFGTYGRGEIVDSIAHYTHKLYTDSLTGAYNRRYYDEQMRNLPNHPAVALLDMDNFKHINDAFGHNAGDSVLRETASCIASCIRTSDTLIRYGGDEFVLIMDDIARDVFYRRLETIRERIEAIHLPEYPELKISTSIGGIYASDMLVRDATLRADELLYEAKKQRNKVVYDA